MMVHPNCILHLGMENNGAGIGKDDSMYNNAVTNFGASAVAGKFGGGASFDGTNDYMIAPNFTPTQSGTWGVWVNLASWGTSPTIGNKTILNLPAGAGSIETIAANTIRVRLYDTVFRDFSFSLTNLNEWYFLTVSFDTTSRNYYLNGELLASLFFGGYNLTFGNGFWAGGSYNLYINRLYNGILDELTIWNVALSQTNVQRLMMGFTPII